MRIPKSYPIIARAAAISLHVKRHPVDASLQGAGRQKKVTDLVDEMIVTGPIEITMQSKVAECFPWRFIGVDGLASVG